MRNARIERVLHDVSHRPSTPAISVIVPTLREASRIEACVARLRTDPAVAEVIVVDGGSDDQTAERAAGAGARVLRSRRGRGRQLAVGARQAHGEILVFLHVDCTLPARAFAQMTSALRDARVIGGAFRTKHVADAAHPRWIRPLLPLADLRSFYTRLPYGDQALFVRAEAYRRAGGFADLPLFEDVDLARRLWLQGELRVLHDRVEVSARRYAAHPLRTAAIMNTWPALARLGVPLPWLARAYGVSR